MLRRQIASRSMAIRSACSFSAWLLDRQAGREDSSTGERQNTAFDTFRPFNRFAPLRRDTIIGCSHLKRSNRLLHVRGL